MGMIEALDVLGLQGGGGEPFARFLNSLIRAHAYVLRIPDTQISTTVRTNIADGGVDTAIHAAAPNDTTGRVAVCTAWQFKATSYREVSDQDLRKEIGKSYAGELIKKGYGYRFCICDDPPDRKKADWEAILTTESRRFNIGAPTAQVLTASDLAVWASRFPAIAGNIFNRPMGIARHWGAWETSETQFTPEYSLPEGWGPHLSAIQGHINFNIEAADSILTIQGAAGVGKTRLVFEAVRQTPNASQLMILTDDDEQAVEVARWLVNHGAMSAILIADECPVEGREKLRKILRGSESRIRTVAIDNTGEPTPGGAPGIWLDKIDVRSVEEILKLNYGAILSERLAYADLSGGYVRLAADLCRHDQQMYSAGTIGPAILHLDEYYRSRLSDDERRVVEAVSLLQRVGCDEDVVEELNQLSPLPVSIPRPCATRLSA